MARLPFTPFPPCHPTMGGEPYTVEADGHLVFKGSEFWAGIVATLWRPFAKTVFTFDCGGRQVA